MNKPEASMIECPVCKGTGERSNGTKCKKCNGKGVVHENLANSTLLRD